MTPGADTAAILDEHARAVREFGTRVHQIVTRLLALFGRRG
jgi:hypothetical protein